VSATGEAAAATAPAGLPREIDAVVAKALDALRPAD
jgi:hypothetical protein